MLLSSEVQNSALMWTKPKESSIEYDSTSCTFQQKKQSGLRTCITNREQSPQGIKMMTLWPLCAVWNTSQHQPWQNGWYT